MEDILNKIVEHKRREISNHNYQDIEQKAKAETRPTISMAKSLLTKRGGIIAEFKRHSPSKKWINQNANVATVVAGYCEAGAAACSILTNEEFFKGSIEHLRTARSVAVNTPLLCKEFIIDAKQIYEARIAGADAVLLIAACLSKSECEELAKVAHSVNLEVLLEVHSESELEYINPYIDMLGVNNRNLGTFNTSVENSHLLSRTIKALNINIPLVSESGIDSAQTIKDLQNSGFNGFLIGEQFMSSNNPSETLKQLIAQL